MRRWTILRAGLPMRALVATVGQRVGSAEQPDELLRIGAGLSKRSEPLRWLSEWVKCYANGRPGVIIQTILSLTAFLGFLCSSAHAVPVHSFTESGEKFLFTLSESERDRHDGGYNLGTIFQGDVAYVREPGFLLIAFDPQHMIQGQSTTGVTFDFPGTRWEGGVDFRVSDSDLISGLHTITSSASFEHPGGTFPGGAIGSGVDHYNATLVVDSLVVDFGNTSTQDILSYNFTLRGIHSSGAPEPSTLLLLGSGLAGLASWRWKQVKAYFTYSHTV